MGIRRLWVSLVVGVAVVALPALFAGAARGSFGWGGGGGGCIGAYPLPTFSSRLSGSTPGIGPVGTQVTETEGSWTDSCGTITSISYNFYRDGATVVKTSHWSTIPSGGSPAYYNTQSADAGHVITADATACDDATPQNCATYSPIGSFAPTPTGFTPSGSKVGVNSDAYDTCDPTATAYDGAANSQWARVFIHWDTFEPSQGVYPVTPGAPQSAIDYGQTITSCIEALHNAGEKVLVDFDASPCWATDSWVSGSRNTTAKVWNEPPDNSTCTVGGVREACYGAAAVELANETASACDTGGDLCGIQAVEVWNEENTPDYWSCPCTTGGKLSEYKQLLAATYSQITPLRSTVNSAPWQPLVVLGGTAKITAASGCAPVAQGQPGSSCTSTCDVTCATWDYHILTDSGDYPQYFDVLGTHTYASNNYQRTYTAPPNVATLLNSTSVNGNDTLDHLISLCDTYCTNKSQTAIWITEFGMDIEPGSMWGTNDTTAATALTNYYNYIRPGSACSCSQVKWAFWFTDYNPNADGFGMLDLADNPKPQYAAFANLP